MSSDSIIFITILLVSIGITLYFLVFKEKQPIQTTPPVTNTGGPTTTTPPVTPSLTPTNTGGATTTPPVNQMAQRYNNLVDLLEYPRYNISNNPNGFRNSLSIFKKRDVTQEFSESTPFPGISTNGLDPFTLADENSDCGTNYSPIDNALDCNLAWLYTNTYNTIGLNQNNYLSTCEGDNAPTSPPFYAPWKSESGCDQVGSAVYNTPDRGDGNHRNRSEISFLGGAENQPSWNYHEKNDPNQDGYQIGGPKTSAKGLENPICYFETNARNSALRQNWYNTSPGATNAPQDNKRLLCKRDDWNWEDYS